MTAVSLCLMQYQLDVCCITASTRIILNWCIRPAGLVQCLRRRNDRMKLIVTGSYEESDRIAWICLKRLLLIRRIPSWDVRREAPYRAVSVSDRGTTGPEKSTFQAFVPINLDEYAGLTKGHSQSFGYFMEQHLFLKLILKGKYYAD